jgi:hypothetical protein
MKQNDLINHINNNVRFGEDVDIESVELIQLIIDHMNDTTFANEDGNVDMSNLLHPLLHDVKESTDLSMEQLDLLIPIANIATRRIIECLLAQKHEYQHDVCGPRDLSELIEQIVELNLLDDKRECDVEDLMAAYDIDHDMAVSLKMLIAVECWRP